MKKITVISLITGLMLISACAQSDTSNVWESGPVYAEESTPDTMVQKDYRLYQDHMQY